MAPAAMIRWAALVALAIALAPDEASAQCPRGQEINADTANHCCWPGQAWSKARSVCIGIPLCPPGYAVQGEGCQREACPEGQTLSEETLDHCCWPGQVWSNSKSRCVGVPQSCPNGRALLGEDCAPASCSPGQVRMKEGACCWQGQTWWADRATCIGTPTSCPSGTRPQPEGCISTGWTGFGQEAAGSEPEPVVQAAAQPAEDPFPAPPMVDALTLVPVGTPAPAAPVAPVASGPPPAPAAGAPVAFVDGQPPPAEEEPKGPKRSRTTLAAGILLSNGYAGALALRVRAGVMSIMAESQFKGTLAILIEPWVWMGGRADHTVTWFRAGVALNLGLGWEQRLGPVEVTPRVGLFNGFEFRTMLESAVAANSFDYLFKGIFGVTAAVPAGDGAKFVVGFDAYVGNIPLFFLSVGVVF